jgi:3-isopropylmalate dehydrogenase
MDLDIAVLGGEGVGPEVTAVAVDVLRAACDRFGHALRLRTIDRLAESEFERIAGSDALLFGAVGGVAGASADPARSPERLLLLLRKSLGLYANLRFVRAQAALAAASPLRPELVAGVDIVVVRELAGGLYYGKPSGRSEDGGVRRAVDTLPYAEDEIARIARTAFEIAAARPRASLVSVDKANVLATSRLWREILDEIAREFPAVTLTHLLVDNAAMKLVTEPRAFDVIVTENMFGDILTDEAAVIAGSIGLLPSASLGAALNRHGKPFGLYEPIHGSAPDIAGKGIANPVGAIASAALLLRYSAGLPAEAAAVERAIERALDDGFRTADLAGSASAACETGVFGRAVLERLQATT